MSAFLKSEVDKLRVIRTQALGMLKNAEDANERAIAESKIIEIDREIKAWSDAYKKVTYQPDFS